MDRVLEINDRLICALDVRDIDAAKSIVQELDGIVSFFKIGIVLHLATGLELVNWLIQNGKKVFLDLKYYDVPETVKQATKQVSELGVSFLTIHGNGEIVREAVKGRGSANLKLLSVTVLTSLDDRDLHDLGIQTSVENLVLLRAKKALEYGCDGVVSSPREASIIKRETGGGLIIVTPGIRPKENEIQDHKRFATPKEAIRAGADYLVVGRPIIGAPDRKEAALRIIDEMAAAL